MKVGSDADYILEFKGIGKYFPGVQALKDVSFMVRGNTGAAGRKWGWKVHLNEDFSRRLHKR